MFAAIITDCKDDNALGRSQVRLSQFVQCPITTVWVNGWDADLEAAGNLIDLLDASEGKPGVIIVNVAPRHKGAKKWPNGTPFSYFHYKETLVVCSIDGLTLSLVKKLGIVDHVNIMDIPTVLASLLEQGVVDQFLVDHITHTQFRSFEFLPRVAGWILDGLEIPHEKYFLAEVEDAPKAVWWIDNFGNCKTTLCVEDVKDFKAGDVISTKFGELTCYNRLKDVPDEVPALIVGSSGLGEKRFLEVVVQGVSAEKALSIISGQDVFS